MDDARDDLAVTKREARNRTRRALTASRRKAEAVERVEDMRRWRKCANPACDMPLVQNEHVEGRADRQYCDDACRQAAYRARKKEKTS